MNAKFLGILLTALFLGACSSKDRVSEETVSAAKQLPSGPPAIVSVPSPPLGSDAPSAVLKPIDLPVVPEEPAAASHHNEAHEAPKGIAPEVSLRWLKNGNVRFMRKRFRADGKGAADRLRLLKGQKPHAIVLSCSDSRVPPEHVFDQALGEVFVIRVAGEALDSSVIASIEYALEHLGSRLLVVMGHDSCGAVKAAVTIPAGKTAGSPSLDALLADIRPRVTPVMRNPLVEDVKVESSVNATKVAEDLVLRSPLIRQKVEGGSLKIVPALYNMGPGNVQFFE
jgi:carbonic anhydrase